MTHLPINAADFAIKAVDGFVQAHPRHVRRVDGGVVRLAPIPSGQVGLVVGGGSGHYPAFAGLVGRGLAAGAVCGNIFASPSAGQVYRVGTAVERGAGLLLAFGNYAGDVLHFSLGAERLRRQGIDVRTLAVTDDIASGPADQPELRRGIAGGLVVYKIAGAAAEAGLDLDAVERLAQKANARTRSLAVAFSGCTLPGAAEPLFVVPSQRMAIGMGLHGEPGLSEGPIVSADELAALLVERLLAERPAEVDPSKQRVLALLSGLGSFKYDELFLLFGAVAEELRVAGVVMADCECGELVTSLDMAGVSLSLCWLDAELEPLWMAAADTPAYRRGVFDDHPDAPAAGISSWTAASPAAPAADPLPATATATATATSTATATAGSGSAGQQHLLERLRAVEQELQQRQEELGALDAVAGDGDHGLGMVRGIQGALNSAVSTVARGGSTATLLIEAGEAWSDQGGGTSGALWGGALVAAGEQLASAEASAAAVASAVAAALEAVMALGKAAPGDKTMVDALQPFSERLQAGLQAGESLEVALHNGAVVSLEAALATACTGAQARPSQAPWSSQPGASRSRGHVPGLWPDGCHQTTGFSPSLSPAAPSPNRPLNLGLPGLCLAAGCPP